MPPGGKLYYPTREECDELLAAIRGGARPYVAMCQLRETSPRLTMSAFKRQADWDPEFAEALSEAKVVQMEGRREFVESRLVENVERAMQAKPVLDDKGQETGEWRYEGSVANRALELIGRSAGMFGEQVQVELTGAGGGPVEVEDRSASLESVQAILTSVLAARNSRAALDEQVADTRELLPADLDG